MALVLNSNKSVRNTENSFSILDSLTAAEVVSNFQNRVLADGGQIVDATFLSKVANFLVNNKLLGKVHLVASANLGVKVNPSGAVEKLYNIVGDKDLRMYARTVVSQAVTDTLGNIARLPTLASDSRYYVNLNTAGAGNTSSASGNILKQDKSQLTSGYSMSVSMVAEPVFPESYTPSFLNLFDFGLSKSVADQVMWAATTNNTTGNNMVPLYFEESGTGVINTLALQSPSLRKDNVVHSFAKDNDYALISNKTSASSDAYTTKYTTQRVSLSPSFESERQLAIGTRTVKDLETTMANLKVYDVFALRDLPDAATSLLVRDFLESELKAKFGNRQ